jgi:hypothetical protein
MNVDELRSAIWDYLFQARDAKTIDELAAAAERDTTVIRGAVEHQWFTVVDGRVSIAY